MGESQSLVAAGNTYNPCLLVLQGKGYQLSTEETADDVLWLASKDGHSFMAYSPPELLGIAVLWETFGDDWNRQNPDLLSQVCDHFAD